MGVATITLPVVKTDSAAQGNTAPPMTIARQQRAAAEILSLRFFIVFLVVSNFEISLVEPKPLRIIRVFMVTSLWSWVVASVEVARRRVMVWGPCPAFRRRDGSPTSGSVPL